MLLRTNRIFLQRPFIKKLYSNSKISSLVKTPWRYPTDIAYLNDIQSEQITSSLVKDSIDFLLKHKVYHCVGINGLRYRPGPIHDIYCAVIKEDEFFINRIDIKYLSDVFKQMERSFFTEKNLLHCERITGSLYNEFFSHVPLYRITDCDNKEWPGCEMIGGYNDNYVGWTYLAPKVIL